MEKRKTFFHTPDEATSVGLMKACVLLKIYSVIEKLDSRIFISFVLDFDLNS